MSDEQPYRPPQVTEPPGRQPGSPPSEAQVVFDTVTGPNLRLRDNLIQLATIVFGTLLGIGIGLWVGRGTRDPGLAIFVGGLLDWSGRCSFREP